MVKRIVSYEKSLCIKSQGADPAPPLGTVLGNLGVNTTNFCLQFNGYTKGLPNCYTVITHIKITENRSFSFTVSRPNIGMIIGFLKFERTIKIRSGGCGKDKVIFCIELYEVLKLAKWKFGCINEMILKTILASIRSFGLVVVRSRIVSEKIVKQN